jgi:hypothetical protein
MTGVVIARPSLLGRLSEQFRPAALAPTPGGDLRALADPRVSMPRVAAILAGLSVPLVLVTAPGQVSDGHSYAEIIALALILVSAMTLAANLPWTSWRPDALVAIVAGEVVFVATLNSLTGGGSSPYFALYAPVLALAGWYLSRSGLVSVIVLIAGTEIWRALVIEPDGAVTQLAIGLPLFALLGVIASVTAERLLAAIAVLRENQVQGVGTLDAVLKIGNDESVDPLDQLAEAAERVFRASAILVRLPRPQPSEGRAARPVVHGKGARIAIAGRENTYALLQVWRDIEFSAGDTRILALLAEVTARALDARRSSETEAVPG